MKDRLEHYIRENKRAFDLEEPPADLWSKIDEQLHGHKIVDLKPIPGQPKRLVQLRFILTGAASLALVICTALWIYTLTQNQSAEIIAMDPQLAKQQVHYATLIEIKRSELKRIEQEEPRLYQEFSSEIRKMDENYQRLKSDLQVSPNQEEVFKAMIRNLQIQTELLNQQLRIIEQINKVKKEISNENQSI